VVGDDAVADGQPKAYAAGLASGEEHTKDVCRVLFWDVGAGIADRNEQLVAVGWTDCDGQSVVRPHGLKKFLVMGNHDVCHPCNKKKAEAAWPLYAESGFKILGLEAPLEIYGEKVRLHHMPYQETSAEEGYAPEPKHLQYRPKDDGMWLLHGHVHEKWRVKNKMINVGVDVWDFHPVPLEEIERIISGYR